MLKSVNVALEYPICRCSQEKRKLMIVINTTKVTISCETCETEYKSSAPLYYTYDREVGTTKERLESEMATLNERINSAEARIFQIEAALIKIAMRETKK